MEPFLGDGCGNPSSLHTEGRTARAAVERARAQVAALVGASPDQVVFTSGGTEANNLALTGVLTGAAGRPFRMVTSTIEHPAVLATTRALVRRGAAQVMTAGVNADGVVEVEALRAALLPETRLVSVMAANNVTGVLQPVAEIAAVAHAHGALFHTDAVQAVGKLPLNCERDGFDLLSVSAHKLHGPQGVGALIARADIGLGPVLHGGGQERGLRSGTENVAGIVGFGAAAEIVLRERSDESVRLIAMRDHLADGIRRVLPEAYLIGHPFRRLPGHLCMGFAGLEGESITLLLALDEAGFAVSTGSACSAHRASEPSYVLQAMGFDAFRARGALRITLGRYNTAAEVERLLETLPAIVKRLRPITQRTMRPMGVMA